MRCKVPSSAGAGGASRSRPSETRTRQVEQRPRPPQTEACGIPAQRLASRIEKPRGTVMRLSARYAMRIPPLRLSYEPRSARKRRTAATSAK